MDKTQIAGEYAIVDCYDGITIVLSSWLLTNGEEVTHFLYPTNPTGHKIVKLLLSKASLENENSKIIDITELLEFTGINYLKFHLFNFNFNLIFIKIHLANSLKTLKF